MTDDLEEIPAGITIETRRMPPMDRDKDYVKIRGIVSLITPSSPIKDYHGKLNKHLTLKTVYFGQGGYYWNEWLEDENQGCLTSRYSPSNKIDEPFSSYSKERLEEWQQSAIKHHDTTLEKIREIYWNGKELSEDI